MLIHLPLAQLSSEDRGLKFHYCCRINFFKIVKHIWQIKLTLNVLTQQGSSQNSGQLNNIAASSKGQQTAFKTALQLSSDLLSLAYLGNLDTPVKQQLGANVVLVLVDVVEEAPVRHQLCHQLDGGTQADTQQAHQVGVLHARHDQGLLLRPENISHVMKYEVVLMERRWNNICVLFCWLRTSRDIGQKGQTVVSNEHSRPCL